MYLNYLAADARATGHPVTEGPGWIGHNHGAMNSVSCIVIHHTATPGTAGDYPSYNVVRNGRTGLPGPLAQLGVGRSGRIYVFSNGQSWHAGATHYTWQNNQNAVGIEVESPGTGTPWPSVQVEATAKMTAKLCIRYNVPVSRVLGHKEIAYPTGRKIDPVGIPGDMPAFRTKVQNYINIYKSGGTTPEENEVELYDAFNEDEITKRPGTVGHTFLNIKQNAAAIRTLIGDLSASVELNAYRGVSNFFADAADANSAAGQRFAAALRPCLSEVDANVPVDELVTKVAAAMKTAMSEGLVDVNVTVANKTEPPTA